MSQLNIFANESFIFTSTSHSSLPKSTSFKPLEPSSDPRWTQTLSWASRTLPQLAFIPLHFRYDNKIFRCLEDPRPSVELSDGRWRLISTSQSSWKLLEYNLKYVISILTADIMLPLDLQLFHFPESFGYFRSHSAKQIAERCAQNSRNAFLPLVGMCSLAVAMNLHPSRENELEPEWEARLKKRGVHPVWIDDFRQSQVVDFRSTKRVGTVVHPQCGWLDLVPLMLNANVPLIFYWDEQEPSATYSSVIKGHVVKNFCPTKEQVVQLRRAQHGTSSAVPSSRHLSPPTINQEALADDAPTMEEGSRQRLGETWVEFFRRDQQEYEHALLTESPALRQKRISREQSASVQVLPPGRKGCQVWEWEKVGSYWVRRRVTRKQVEDVWVNYAKTQRRFNGIRNEWDLCEALDPAAILDEDDEGPYAEMLEAHLQMQGYEETAPVALSMQAYPTNQEVVSASTAAVANVQGPMVLPSFTHQHEVLDMLVYHRYGFHPTPGYDKNLQLFPHDINSTRTILAVGSENFISDPAKLALFVAALQENRSPSWSMWDLDRRNDASLIDQDDYRVTVRALPVSDGIYYVVEPRDGPSESDPTWQVVVTSPSTALECLRRHEWGNSRESLARNLLARGMRFYTVGPQPTFRYDASSPFVQQVRNEGYKADKYDYRQYEENLREYFKESSHTRAAFLSGGLLWRLAREVLGDELEQYALSGPSEEVGLHGRTFKLNPHGLQVWDDELTLQDTDFIVGVVRILTGNRDQTKEPSWWPKLHVFESSGLNIGYWSHDCERWFTHRLSKIRSGEESPMMPSRWPRALRFSGRTKAMVRGAERCASNFIISYPERFGP